MLAVIESGMSTKPSTRKGSFMESSSLSASSSGPAASDSPSARIANSSPRSPDGVARPEHTREARGHRLQQLVPGLLSSLSLTSGSVQIDEEGGDEEVIPLRSQQHLLETVSDESPIRRHVRKSCPV